MVRRCQKRSRVASCCGISKMSLPSPASLTSLLTPIIERCSKRCAGMVLWCTVAALGDALYTRLHTPPPSLRLTSAPGHRVRRH